VRPRPGHAFSTAIVCALALTTGAAIAAAGSAAAARLQPRIVHGAPTPIEHAPFQVALYDPEAVDPEEPDNLLAAQFCGGVIRDATHVVTAAHCVTLGGFEAAAPEEIEVLAGSASLQAPEVGSIEDPVVATSFDPEWEPFGFEHDVGVLTLEKPLWEGATPEIGGLGVKIAPIGFAATDPLAGSNATVSGWGFDQPLTPEQEPTEAEEELDHPAMLQSAEVSIVARAECSADYAGEGFPPFNEQLICAGGSGSEPADACYGDSGGPLFSGPLGSPEDRLLGLVDFGEGCAQKEFPGVYQSVVSGQNRTFASSDPPQAPRNTGVPAIVGTLEAGHTVTCQPGSWVGAALQFGYTYYRDEASVLEPFAVEALTGESPSPDYAIQGRDVGKRIFCAVTARNAGGVGEAISRDAVIPAFTLPQIVPGVPVSPGPPAKASPPPTPTPTLRLLSARCRRGTCTVTVRASKGTGTAAVTKVEATLSFVRRVSCRKHGRRSTCRRLLTRRLGARPLGSERFSVTATGLRPGPYTMALVAVSGAGTRQTHATSVPLLLKAARARR
jgi:trypsin